MSNFNFSWLYENFTEDSVFFDIGCADMDDSIQIRKNFLNSKIYAFECNNDFLVSNISNANSFNIQYRHCAIGEENSICTFYPSGTFHGQKWSYSGSICKPGTPLMSDEWSWAEPYSVESKTIETICIEENVHPDFIWIDAQGAEQKILSKMGIFKPKAIWAETCEFTRYEGTGTTNEGFKKFMDELGYIEFHYDGADSLFTLKDVTFTSYVKK